MYTNRSSSNLHYKLEDLAQRQPELLLIGALAGGFLLGYLVGNANGSREMRPSRRLSAHYSSRDASRARGDLGYATSPRSSARLGATEDQVNRSPQQSSAGAVSRDEVSTTGTAYELDPKSITGG
ncbi:hypothetical protein BH10CHL1_BH10CHL1_07300 [soil metagenome]